MNLHQHLTICALLLTCQHGDVVTLPLCKGSHTIAAEPEDDVNFPNVGNRWLTERNHENNIDNNNNISHTVSQSINGNVLERMENINRPTAQATANQRQEPLLSSSNALTQTQPGAAANARTTQSNLHANQAAPTTTQHSNNYWQLFYPNQHSANLAPAHLMPVVPAYPQYLRVNSIFPTTQVLELSPQRLNTPSRGRLARAQRHISTRRDLAQVAALPLYRHWAILNNPNSPSDSSAVQERYNSIRSGDSFTYLLD